MKADLKQEILNRLLDKYERSSSFRTGKAPIRRFLLRFYDGGATDFPLYDIDSSEKRRHINVIVLELAAQGLVHFEWMRGEEGHILAKVWLEPAALDKAYRLTGRQPKHQLVEDIQLELLTLADGLILDWSKAWCDTMLERIEATRKIPALIPTDTEERSLLFKVLRGLQEEAGQEVTARVFSMKYLGDSKAFEKTAKPRLLSILRQSLVHDDDARDDDLLRQVGIVRYPEQFEFRGRLRYIGSQGKTDFSALSKGSSLSAGDLDQGTLQIDSSVRRILTIENRANYFDALERREDSTELIIYHGGQYSPARKKFFLAVCKAMPEGCRWAHWGDMDFGGYSMLARLRREIDAGILAYRMDQAELTGYKSRAANITQEYAKRLEQLANLPELLDCAPIIRALAHQKLRLEQEALLFN